MAIYWHPLLAQFLKEDYGDRLEIKDSVKIGKMPLELDILITPSVPTEELPYPFNYLGGTTIAELKRITNYELRITNLIGRSPTLRL